MTELACTVRIKEGWIEGRIVSRNKKTLWVRIPDKDRRGGTKIIKRKWSQVSV